MEAYIEKANKFYINRYKVLYIYITSILAYFILKMFAVNENVNIPLMFRSFYIILSIVLFVLLQQVNKFYKQYISKIVAEFFSLMIFISAVGLIININEKNFLSQKNLIYIAISKESILLIETFCIYALSQYIYKNIELKKSAYQVVILIIASLGLSYYYDETTYLVKIVYLIIGIPLFARIVINIKKVCIFKAEEYSMLKIYICSTIIILIANIYNFYGNETIGNAVIEIIHLINFRITWNFIVIKLIREPYKTLSNSLNEKNKELDRLNLKILEGNKELEKSINLLKSEEYLYSTFFRFMPHPIIILNAANDRILFVNRQFLRIIGISKARDIINKKISKYLEYMPPSEVNENYNAIIYIGEERRFVEAKLLSNYSDENKKLILIKDNTSKVQTEEIKKEVENRKLDEIIRAEFLSSISHDLKTPINVIYSAMQVEKIYIDKADLEILQKYNNISRQNCISLIKLTNNLIDNSKINSHFLVPRLEYINIVEVIEENVMSLIDYVKWSNIDLIFDTNTEECYLNVDHEFMDRIILNLVSNAVKYTPDGGKIYVIISDYGEDVNILVKDNGSGIEEEFIYQAFNRYAVGEACKPDRKSGTGIGLSVVKQLVELQGGTIQIKRNEEVGTTISMKFKKENKNV
ncbi:HAMP domain-containing sensor histidine kinase [Clostridium sp. C2-6-12]|uniref:sensor histidine kinase n=1 Tax=Clostridium sp. C2-6-12 TaxID=2698832 RepID=UPI00136F07F1|nr:HAMP domain-containing sensor histidine kinase [Clostridium sp. C2-6-12]